MIAAEYVSEPVTEYTVCQWFFPSLDSHPQVNQMRSFAYILPCLLQQCWSLLSLSIGLRDPRLSDLTCRSFGRCTLEQSRGFPHPRLACPTGFCPQPTAKMCPNMTSETSLGATAPFSGPLWQLSPGHGQERWIRHHWKSLWWCTLPRQGPLGPSLHSPCHTTASQAATVGPRAASLVLAFKVSCD